MVKAIVKKIRNIILLFVMFVNVTGTSIENKQETKQENNFTKDVIIEIIGIDNTVIEFFEYMFELN